MIAIKKILAPTDCSEPSSDALFYATGIAKNFKADLIVLKVFSSPVETIQKGMVIRDYNLDKERPEQVQEIEEFWNRFAESSIKPEFVNLLGDPFDEILRY
jgi:nucleotide-binding universal stress UspA family protein